VIGEIVNEGKSMTDEEFEVFLGKLRLLLDGAPSRMDRAFRAYAIKAALDADQDGTEFKRLMNLLMRKAEEDRDAGGDERGSGGEGELVVMVRV
jgi:hypothetical protein